MFALTIGVEENIQEVVGHITEGVCRPLKVKYFLFLSTLNTKTVLSCFFRTRAPIFSMYVHCPWLRIRLSASEGFFCQIKDSFVHSYGVYSSHIVRDARMINLSLGFVLLFLC